MQDWAAARGADLAPAADALREQRDDLRTVMSLMIEEMPAGSPSEDPLI
jgi:hypothetical protein